MSTTALWQQRDFMPALWADRWAEEARLRHHCVNPFTHVSLKTRDEAADGVRAILFGRAS